MENVADGVGVGRVRHKRTKKKIEMKKKRNVNDERET